MAWGGARKGFWWALGAAAALGAVALAKKGGYVPDTAIAYHGGLPVGVIVLKSIGTSPSGNDVQVRNDVADKFLAMFAAAKAEAKLVINPVSGFRSIEKQTVLYAKYLAGQGPLTAKPGFSNHQGGTAADLDVGMSVADLQGGKTTKIFQWLEQNSTRFGLHRLPAEPWHFSLDGH